MNDTSQQSTTGTGSHGLRRQLGLRDLLPMQILMVVGITWAGLAARQGPTHVAFWLLGVLLLFLPVAGVVQYCVQIWPLEGGVYQWTRHALGPFAGFLSAWNFAIWALLVVSSLGILTATSLSYALGPGAAWMETSKALINTLSIGLFALILLVNIPGMGLGRWVAHFGTAVTLLVTTLLMGLLVLHPHASSAHPHVSPQRPFSLAFPAVTLLGLNLFAKLTFNALTGLEQVAVFAGETRNAARAILRSAWIAAPVIVLIYVSMAGAMLTYTPADKIDLTGPIPQVLAEAFDSGASSSIDIGLLLGRGAILLLAVATVAQYAMIVAETARLPMVAAWDHLLPPWFTRLHPRFGTPTRSLAVIVLLAVLMCLLANAGSGNQEAFQVLVTCGNVCYAINYLLMFSVPLVAGVRFGRRAGLLLRGACIAGMLVTLLYIVVALIPVVEVNSPGLYALKIALTTLAANLVGAALYWRAASGARGGGAGSAGGGGSLPE
jgi:amino acid transporter